MEVVKDTIFNMLQYFSLFYSLQQQVLWA